MLKQKKERQQRQQEIGSIVAVAHKNGSQMLLENLLYGGAAICYLLTLETPEAKQLKQSLCTILWGENPLQQNGHIDATPTESNSQQPQLPFYIQQTPIEIQQILAVRYLSPLIDADSQVYKTILAVARGTHSPHPQVADAAINALAQSSGIIKDKLKECAINALIPEDLRITAYTALALSGILSDQKTLDFVSALAIDTSIIDYYQTRGKLSQNAAFFYRQEERAQEPRHRFLTPKNVEDLRVTAVERAQKEFQEQLLGVVGYVLERNAVDRLFYSFQSVKFEDLTSQLCKLTERNPAAGIPVLCKYATRLALSINQLSMIYETLDGLKDRADRLGYQHIVKKTLNEIDGIGNWLIQY